VSLQRFIEKIGMVLMERHFYSSLRKIFILIKFILRIKKFWVFCNGVFWLERKFSLVRREEVRVRGWGDCEGGWLPGLVKGVVIDHEKVFFWIKSWSLILREISWGDYGWSWTGMAFWLWVETSFRPGRQII
jgi:hypothetical protein